MMFTPRNRQRRRAHPENGAWCSIIGGAHGRLGARAHDRFGEGRWRPTLVRSSRRWRTLQLLHQPDGGRASGCAARSVALL